MKNKYIIFLSIFLIVQLFLACQSNTTSKQANNDWNVGSIDIEADSNLKDVLQPLVVIYQNYFPKAHINFIYTPEDITIQRFKTKKNRAIAISRLLDDNELNNASIAQDVELEKITFAYDAIAVITNKENVDSVFTIEQTKSRLNNKQTQLVFDNAKSGIARTLMQISQSSKDDFKQAYVLQNADEVIEYVRRNKNAIGFIPFNLLSNKFEQKAQFIRANFKILPVSYKNKVTAISQQTIANEQYPLDRPISIYIGSCPELVIQGFTSFLLKRQISKAILLSGLVPKNMPVRDIVVSEEFNPEK
ncbi:MAG: substrate-binding domain-containing protein [Chitinophagales bacterium]